MFRRHILPVLAWLLYSSWTWTWRTKLVEPDSLQTDLREQNPLILAHWHGDELALFPLVKRYRLATMTSKSQDGQLVDFVIRRYGGSTSRGSSTHGGASALKGLIRLMKKNLSASMAVDGPKGPLREVKPGVFELSRMAKARIYPVGMAASSFIRLHGSWNKAILPKPFSRVVVYYGEPMKCITRDLDPKSLDLARQLKTAIDDACGQAGKYMARG